MSEDKERFRTVVQPHLSDAYALARWLTGNAADAEDVVQEACLRAFRGIGGYNGGNARAWVLTIVRNTAFNWLAKTRSHAMTPIDDEDSLHHPADLATPEAVLAAKTDAARVEAAIAALPEALRETFVLREVHELDYKEIAQVTGVPIGTVMSRLARSRNRLLAVLGDAKDE